MSRVMSAALVAIVFGMTGAEACFADCEAQMRIEARSPNRECRLEINRLKSDLFDFTLRRNDAVVDAGQLHQLAGHWTAYVDDTGSYFVLHDEYEGLLIYDAQGRQLGNFTVNDLLTVRELAMRPHRWACHPEGRWAKEFHAVRFVGSAALQAITHTGRKITIELPSARIVRADRDAVQDSFLIGTAIAVTAATVSLRRQRQQRIR